MSRTELNPWAVVAVGFVALALGFTFRSILGLSIPEWEKPLAQGGLAWSRALISSAGAMALVVMAVLFPLVGAIVDRIGVRAVLAAGCAMLALAMTLIGLMQAPWQLLAAFGAAGGIAFTLVGNNVITVMVARAFATRQGFATGVATSGSTGGQLLLVPVLAVAFGAIGWRASYFIIAAACALLAVVAWWLLGRSDAAGRPAAPAAGAPRPASFGAAARTLFSDPGYHALLAAFFVCGITTTGIIETHFIPFAVACGFPPVMSALAFSVLSILNFAGMTAAGWASDRWNRSHLLAGIYFLRGLAFLLALAVGNDYTMLIVFAALLGIVEYSSFPPTAGLAAARYGVANMGKAMGFLMTSHSLGAALGAWGGGRVFTAFGSYDWAWIGCTLTAIAAAVVSLACRDPRRGGAAPGTRPSPAAA